MNTNMTGFRFLFKNLWVLVLRTKEASALEGLSLQNILKKGYYLYLVEALLLEMECMNTKGKCK